MSGEPPGAVQARLRAGLRGRGLSLAWFSMGSVPLVELGAAQGFDAVVVDLQHGLWDRLGAHLAVTAAGDVPVIVRTLSSDAAAVGEALDSGAAGVFAPLVESAEQARSAVTAARFPPRGVRSGGGVRPLGQGFARYFAAHAETLVGVMIETAAGVERAAEIAAVPGLDFVFIGTGDLALSLGCFPEVDGRHEAACRAVRDACRAAGVPCGIYSASAEGAAARLAEGYAAAVAANDIDVAVAGFAAAARTARRGAGEG